MITCQVSTFLSYIMVRTSYSEDVDVSFVLDQHAELDYYRASSLQQMSEGTHVAPL